MTDPAPETVLPVTLDELKTHLNLPSADAGQDPELTLHLRSAIQAVEKRIGPLTHREFTEKVRARNGCITVNQTPLVSVSAVTERIGNVVWDIEGLDVDDAGIISSIYGSRLPTAMFTVTYTAGHGATALERHKLAVLIVAEQLWETQRGNGARPSMFGVAPEGSATSAHEADYVYRGFALPKRALELISGDEQIAFA